MPTNMELATEAVRATLAECGASAPMFDTDTLADRIITAIGVAMPEPTVLTPAAPEPTEPSPPIEPVTPPPLPQPAPPAEVPATDPADTDRAKSWWEKLTDH